MGNKRRGINLSTTVTFDDRRSPLHKKSRNSKRGDCFYRMKGKCKTDVIRIIGINDFAKRYVGTTSYLDKKAFRTQETITVK